MVCVAVHLVAPLRALGVALSGTGSMRMGVGHPLSCRPGFPGAEKVLWDSRHEVGWGCVTSVDPSPQGSGSD
jgi:hypothetical protein